MPPRAARKHAEEPTPTPPKASSSSRTKAPPAPPELELSADTLVADTTNYLVDLFRTESDTPWKQRTEADQQRLINRTNRLVTDLMSKMISIVQAEGREILNGTLKDVKLKDQIEAKLTFDRHDSRRHELFDSVGREVMLVVAEGVERYARAGTVTAAEPDQPPLGLPAPEKANGSAATAH